MEFIEFALSLFLKKKKKSRCLKETVCIYFEHALNINVFFGRDRCMGSCYKVTDIQYIWYKIFWVCVNILYCFTVNFTKHGLTQI